LNRKTTPGETKKKQEKGKRKFLLKRKGETAWMPLEISAKGAPIT